MEKELFLTKMSDIIITDKLGEEYAQPVIPSVLAGQFYGIIDIVYLLDSNDNKIRVYVNTLNYGTISVEELLAIQKGIKAISLTLSFGSQGLVYIFSFNP